MTTQNRIKYRILIYDRVLNGVGCGDIPAVTELKTFSYAPTEIAELQGLPGEVAYAICVAKSEHPKHTIMLEVLEQHAAEPGLVESQHERTKICVRQAIDGLLGFSKELVNRFQQGVMPNEKLEIRLGNIVIRQASDPMVFEVDFTAYGPCQPEMIQELLHSSDIAGSPRVHQILAEQCAGIAISSVHFSYLDTDGCKKSVLFYHK